MKLYYTGDKFTLYHGSMLDMAEVIAEKSVDCVITDPPYELNFMNKGWDNTGIAFQKDTWEKCYQVLKPGGYLLAFGGSRTFHRIACAIEDAGFEIRDTIMWLYGSGFPKSLNVGFAIDKKEREERNAQNAWKGWGTALKPSYEPIIVARKPFPGSLVDNVMEYGVGGINIDESRVGTGTGNTKPEYKPNYKNNLYSKGLGGGDYENTNGRFPANTILTYDDTDFDEVCGGMPYTNSTGGSGEASTVGHFKNVYGEYKGTNKIAHLGGLGDSGSAARYFYCAKASKKDRDEGLNEFENVSAAKITNRKEGSAGKASPNNKNMHPTVKPTELMQYLIRLVAPPGSTILDPFNGSGSTGKAVMFENREKNKNYHYIGIDLSEEYLAISKARIEYAAREYEPEEVLKIGEENIVQTTLF